MRFIRIIFLFLFLMNPALYYCQEEFGKFQIGLSTGLNYGTVKVNNRIVRYLPGDEGVRTNDDPVRGRNSFNVGISIESSLTYRFGLRLKAIYDRKGYGNIVTYDSNDDRIKSDVALDYITFPMQFMIRHNPGFYIGIGPYVGILLSAEVIDFNSPRVIQRDLINKLRSIDLGWDGAIGYSFPINSNIEAFIEYSFHFGVNRLIIDEPFTPTRRHSLKLGAVMKL